MTLSAAFTIDGTTAGTEAVEVAYGAAFALALSSTSDVSSIQWTIEGSSDSSTLTNPTITPAGSPLGATASGTQVADPGTGEGASFLVKCQVQDSDGNTSTQYGVFGTPNLASGLVPCATGEQLARHSTDGWGPTVNGALNDNVGVYAEHDSTDATPAVCGTVDLADETFTVLNVRVVTTETGAVNTDFLVREWSCGYSRQGGAAPNKDVADSDGGVYLHRDDATWSAVVGLNANAAEITVTNDAANACTSRTQIWTTEFPLDS